MSEEDLELLITLDDPLPAQEEDTFNHLQINNLGYWFGQSNKNLNVEVWTVTRWKNGEIVEQKVLKNWPGCNGNLGRCNELQEGHGNELLFALIRNQGSYGKNPERL